MLVSKMVIDYESTMRSCLSHKNKNDKLYIDILIPVILSHPEYRVKVRVKVIFGRVSKTKDKNKIEKYKYDTHQKVHFLLQHAKQARGL